MSESTDQLPTDIEVLQARLAMVLAERDAAIAERDQALSQNDRLRHLLQQLQRMQFGKRSEKLDPDQLALAFEDIEQAIAATEAVDDKKDSVGARAAPRSAAGRSAARSCNDCARRYRLSLLSGADACDPGAVPGDRDAPSQICLPGL